MRPNSNTKEVDATSRTLGMAWCYVACKLCEQRHKDSAIQRRAAMNYRDSSTSTWKFRCGEYGNNAFWISGYNFTDAKILIPCDLRRKPTFLFKLAQVYMRKKWWTYIWFDIERLEKSTLLLFDPVPLLKLTHLKKNKLVGAFHKMNTEWMDKKSYIINFLIDFVVISISWFKTWWRFTHFRICGNDKNLNKTGEFTFIFNYLL